MASNEPKPDPLDLLYDDELDEERLQEAREQLEADPRRHEELTEFEETLEAVRSVDLEAEVPESAHDSIMASAREHAAETTSRKARVIDRTPPKQGSPKESLWSRLGSGQTRRFALAASVLLVAGFVYLALEVQLFDSQARAPAPAQEMAVEETSEPNEPLEDDQAGSADKMLAFDEPGDDELDEQKAVEEEALAEGAADEPEEKPSESSDGKSDESDIGEMAELDQERQARPQRKEKPAASRRAKRSAPEANEDDNLDMFGDSQSSAGSPKEPGEAPSSDVSALGGETADSIADDSERAAEKKEPTAEGRVEAEQDTADRDEAEETPTDVASIESAFRAGEHARVIEEADRFIESADESTEADRARALELKAQSLHEQGKTDEADEAFSELQRKHPGYKSEQVERARRELEADERPDGEAERETESAPSLLKE